MEQRERKTHEDGPSGKSGDVLALKNQLRRLTFAGREDGPPRMTVTDFRERRQTKTHFRCLQMDLQILSQVSQLKGVLKI